MSNDPPMATDRRPVSARRLGVIRGLAASLARAGITANSVSVASLVFAGIAGGLLAATPWTGEIAARVMLIAAAGLIQLRLLANLVDGLVAVEGGQRTPTGELYNEVPDRVSDALVLIGAGYGLTGNSTIGFLAAILAVMTAYIRAVGKGVGAGSDFGGPMAKQQRMMFVTACAAFLALAPASWRPTVPAWGVDLGIMGLTLAVIAAGSALTCLLRLRRIAATMQRGGPR